MKLKHGLLFALMALVAWPAASAATATDGPVAHAAATCADHPNQASAQTAKDTRDADGDGIYCETLPCPCLPPDPRAGSGGTPPAPVPTPIPTAAPTPVPTATPTPSVDEDDDSCTKPTAVQRLVFSARKYPNISSHVRGAIRRGWPRILVLNRPGAAQRRNQLLEDVPTKRGFDRDEYPPAVGRGKGPGLQRGTRPRGWKADVRYVPSSENRSHGAVLGNLLEDFCNGTRFRYAFE
jgi:hypothetical protein